MMTNTAAEQAATRKIPVVLTVKDAVHKIKEDCPGTAITENYLRLSPSADKRRRSAGAESRQQGFDQPRRADRVPDRPNCG